MGMTITEKILTAHAGKKQETMPQEAMPQVFPGELIEADLDFILGNDITAPIAISEFESVEKEKGRELDVFDKERVALVPDNFNPKKDLKSAEQCKIQRNF